MFGVATREREVDATSPKMSPSLSEVMSEVVRPIESRWHVRIGPALFVLLAVLRVSRPVALDLVLP